jgi:hypothetical protein
LNPQESQGGQPSIGFWDRADDWVSWTVRFPSAGKYAVSGLFAAAAGDSALAVQAGERSFSAAVPKTGGWADFKKVEFGILEVKAAGETTVSLKPDAQTGG